MILQSDKTRLVISQFKQDIIDEGIRVKVAEKDEQLFFYFPPDFNDRPVVNRMVVINAFNKMAQTFRDWDIKFTIGVMK